MLIVSNSQDIVWIMNLCLLLGFWKALSDNIQTLGFKTNGAPLEFGTPYHGPAGPGPNPGLKKVEGSLCKVS